MAGLLLAGAAITVTANPAVAADSRITSPSPGAVITSDTSVRIRAEVNDLASTGRLQLKGPADDSFTTVDSGSGTLSYRLNLDCPSYARACSSEYDPDPNGTYTVRLKTDLLGLLPGSRGKRTFDVRLPPRPPTNLEAAVRSGREVRLQWDRGAEPDLVSYDVLLSSGQTLRDGLPADRACGLSLCTTTVTVPSSAGDDVAFRVRAHRRTAPGSSSSIASRPSSADAVTLASAPVPSPSVSMSGVSPETEQSGSEAADALGSAQQPEMRPLASASASDSPSDDGVGSPRIAAGVPEGSLTTSPRVSSPPPASGGQANGPGTSWTAISGSPQWWRAIAVVLILVFVAANLGGLHWRGRARERRRIGDQPSVATVAPFAVTASPASTDSESSPLRNGPGERRRRARSMRRAKVLTGTYRGRRRRTG